jgi:hypothetical protein
MSRQAGKYGRRPMDRSRPRLTLERYLDPRRRLTPAGLPAVPLTQDVDRASEVGSWPMYLNDQLGDCTIAGVAHMYGAWTQYAGAGAGEALFADQQVQTVYSRVGGYVPGDESTDNGCVMQDVLDDQKRRGMIDNAGRTHKIAAYAAFGNVADEELLGQVLDVFGSVYVGINCQASILTEFSQGQPWTWTPGEAVEGGHAICLQRRRGSGDAPLEYVTWGALQPATADFQANAAEEAWAVVTADWLNANGTSVEGLDLQQLLSDMQYV